VVGLPPQQAPRPLLCAAGARPRSCWQHLLLLLVLLLMVARGGRPSLPPHWGWEMLLLAALVAR
jgi:hypothetical protein